MRNLKLFLLILFVWFLSGCATTQIAVKNNSTFTKYKKIYLAKIKPDTRKVTPKVAGALKKLGFEVIEVDADKDPVGGIQGSGFIISEDGYLITGAHVLNKKDKATVWINDSRYEADLIYKEANEKDEKEDSYEQKKSLKERMESALNSKNNQSILEEINEKDLALLKIKSSGSDLKFNPLIFAKNPQYIMGNEIYTIGFPLSYILGDTPRLNKGLISSSVGPKDNPDYFQVSAEMQPGNSGGPLLNSDGQVIGLIRMTLNPINVLEHTGGNLPQNVNFAIKNNVIENFLKNCSDKAKITIKNEGTMTFDTVKGSIAQIRSGIIPAEFKNQPKLFCWVSYQSIWDMWFRFMYFDVIFYDLDTQEVLLKAGQYGDNPFTSEAGTIKTTFQDIKIKIGR